MAKAFDCKSKHKREGGRERENAAGHCSVCTGSEYNPLLTPTRVASAVIHVVSESILVRARERTFAREQ
jgi:hypothetical protein